MTKLIPPAIATVSYPSGNFTVIAYNAWRESVAGQDAFRANENAAADYLNWFSNTWMLNYKAGRIPWDAIPTPPPVKKWALVTEELNPDNSIAFDDVLVDAPTGELVCAVPAFTRNPPPSTGIDLMGKISNEGGPVNPSIFVVPVNSTSTASDGSKWVRIG